MKRAALSLAFVMALSLEASSFSIYMTGDSHVCSKIYPEMVGDILMDADPEITFDYWGKIGASVHTFNTSPGFMERIYDADPDLLVVHLGTNDSYSHHFSEENFERNLEKFYSNVSSHCPDCVIVFVTPFFNKLKDGSVNHSTRLCSDVYLDFARHHKNVYVFDDNAKFGMHFINGGSRLIRNDGVHLTVEGYQELGEQVGQGLIDIQDLWTWCE